MLSTLFLTFFCQNNRNHCFRKKTGVIPNFFFLFLSLKCNIGYHFRHFFILFKYNPLLLRLVFFWSRLYKCLSVSLFPIYVYIFFFPSCVLFLCWSLSLPLSLSILVFPKSLASHSQVMAIKKLRGKFSISIYQYHLSLSPSYSFLSLSSFLSLPSLLPPSLLCLLILISLSLPIFRSCNIKKKITTRFNWKLFNWWLLRWCQRYWKICLHIFFLPLLILCLSLGLWKVIDIFKNDVR